MRLTIPIEHAIKILALPFTYTYATRKDYQHVNEPITVVKIEVETRYYRLFTDNGSHVSVKPGTMVVVNK